MNAKAVLAFGICLGDGDGELPAKLRAAGLDDPDDEDGSFDFDNVIALEGGLGEYPYYGSDAEKSAYFDRKRKAESAMPVQLVRAGSWDYSSYILAVNHTERSAEWGDAKEVADLSVSQPRIDAFLEFCRKYEIDVGDGPKWLMAAFYG